MTLYARAGERITCEAGHPICTVAVDIPLGALHEDGFFTDWQQPEPKKGMRASLLGCLVCGAPWFAGGQTDRIEADGGTSMFVQHPNSLHFGDGWR